MHDLGNTIANSVMTSFILILSFVFVIGVLTGVYAPDVWNFIKPIIHNATS